jgi:hypothetical protein
MSFRSSQFYNSVMNVKKSMFVDIEKTINLSKNSSIGAPNFLLALGLCCYTEYWGRLVKGIATGNGAICFNEFFDRLGQTYTMLRNNNDDVYWKVRCGLAHSYLIESSSAIDMKRGMSCGIEYNIATKHYIFHVPSYFEDFKKAVSSYIQGLESGSENLSLIKQALENKPELV